MTISDALRQNAISDNDLLLKNDEKGDVFSRPRDVDFAFKTKDKNRAEALSDYVQDMNFGISQVRFGDNGYFWVVVVINMTITQHLLCSVSGFMVCLGRLYQVEYDGWGSVIQTK